MALIASNRGHPMKEDCPEQTSLPGCFFGRNALNSRIRRGPAVSSDFNLSTNCHASLRRQAD
ncbi:MAG TPA: hypothetical protein VNQ76_17925 [Planctomicrobium sp.]|nr:hypothetical protein [Planctomicrobium sp.]